MPTWWPVRRCPMPALRPSFLMSRWLSPPGLARPQRRITRGASKAASHPRPWRRRTTPTVERARPRRRAMAGPVRRSRRSASPSSTWPPLPLPTVRSKTPKRGRDRKKPPSPPPSAPRAAFDDAASCAPLDERPSADPGRGVQLRCFDIIFCNIISGNFDSPFAPGMDSLRWQPGAGLGWGLGRRALPSTREFHADVAGVSEDQRILRPVNLQILLDLAGA